MRVVESLASPDGLRTALPITPRAEATVREARRDLRDLLHGRDRDRIAVIAGPCSIHDPQAALEYARRLRDLAAPLAGELLVVMRTFLEKPRTSVGWKGLLNDPDLDGSQDVARGLTLARQLLLDLNELGVPCAAEILEPTTPAYLADLLAWGGVGARTSESQVHRQLASGLPFPVGFKNGTDGGLEVACHAMRSAGVPHRFAGIAPDGGAAVLATTGNPDRHIVLRGGASGANHGADQMARAVAEVAGHGIARPILVDCSHGNSGRDPARQAGVCRDVLRQIRGGRQEILGLMLESQLEPGQQSHTPGTPLAYGVSITDPCIGWNETADLLCEAAEAVKLSR
jgi:3-deoxy-7-phosphoheptulonate synthase